MMGLLNVGSWFSDCTATCSLAVFIATLSAYFFYHRDPAKYPPGPISWPIVGNLVQVGRAKNFYALLKELRGKYGNVFRLHLGQVPLIIVFGHDNISRIMVANGGNTINRPDWLFVPSVVLKKKGIVWTNGKAWQLMNEFIIRVQQDRTVQANIQDQLNLELVEACKGFSDVTATDPSGPFHNVVINIVSLLVFGKRFDYNDPDFKTIKTSIEYIFQNGQTAGRVETFFQCLSLFTKSQVAKLGAENKKVYDVIRDQLKEHKTRNDSSGPQDLLHMYIDLSDKMRENEAFSEINLLQAVVDLFNAGCATYTPTISTAIFYLIKYPNVQDKCRKEINKNISGNSHVTLNDRDKLPYVENMIKEIMRLGKPVVTSVYRTNQQSIPVGEYTIPPHSVILFDLMQQQLDPELWTNPEDFNPDRWTTANQDGYVPFGAGPRQCVAAQTVDITLFLLLTNLMKKYILLAEGKLTLEKEYNGVALKTKPFKMYLKQIES